VTQTPDSKLPKKPPQKLETARSKLFVRTILDTSPDRRRGADLAGYATTIGSTVILVWYWHPIPLGTVERAETTLATILLAGVWLYKTWLALAYGERVERVREKKETEAFVTFMKLCERYCWLQAGFGFWGVGLGTYLIIRHESSLVAEALMLFAVSLLLWQLVTMRRAVEKLRPVIEAYNSEK